MAKLQLTLYNIDSYEINGEKYQSKEDKTVSLSTEKVGVVLYLRSKANTDSIKDYTLNLVECTFQKKMYQPTEILADLQINKASGETWTEISRSIIESMFKHKQVKLEADSYSIGDDFYVHEVLPCYKKESMVVKLKIYSLDKLLTLDKSCYSYVAKKLVSDIIKPKIADYKKPYNKGESLICSDYGSSRDSDKGVHLQVLRFVTKEEESVIGTPQVHESGEDVKESVYTYAEHIFPYLVQYNESFYDMLIRTCNRWGEFVFWEDGQLNIGYNSEAAVKEVGDYNTITYPQQDSNDSLIPSNADQHYFPVGADDGTIRDTNAQKSKWSVKGMIGSLNGMEDVYAVQKFSQFFGTNKDIVTFAVTQVIDDLVDWGIEEAAVSDRNKDYNGKYFPDSGKKDGTTDEQYGQASFMMPDGSMKEKDAMNEFTEIDTKYKDEKYLEILGYEQKALNNVVVIDYDTAWPKLKLGDIIHVDDEEFIVTDISSKKNAEGNQVFRVEGIGKVADKFYPAMQPSGHVRYSGPQKATVKEASSDDPCDLNRVRVAYPWQVDSETGNTIGDLSPRIRIASSDGGANMASRFYVGDSVLIGYVDGNIERPYVLGSVPNMGTIMNNVHSMTTPGGHALNLTDGSGQGFDKFMTTAFTPCVNTVTSFAPASLKMDNLSDWKYNKYFEGGFTLTDRYGIYRIAGSTENRSVSIMSPWGNVMINAFTGIQILAPNGNIKIVGKNVDIAAGNKLTLTSGTNIMGKLKGKNKSEKAFNWLTDLPVAVAEKMSQKLLKVVDLTLVRSIVDIVMRPVEGTLTIKSMRFMKLEAGMMTHCDFPTLAYKKDKKQNQVDKQDVKDLVGIGSDNDEKSLAYGTIEVFKKIPTFAAKIIDDYVRRYYALVHQKLLFNEAIKLLKAKDIVVDPKSPVCSTYDELKNDFWAKGEYQEWTEDKLGFKEENVGIDLNSSPIEWDNFVASNFIDANEYIKYIIALRTRRRKRVLDHANKLRKMICEFCNFDVTMNMVNATFGSLGVESVPANFKEKVKTAASKAKCPNAIIYTDLTNDEKNLGVGFFVAPIEETYLRRLIIYNLLIELGFDKNSRCEIKLNEGDEETTAIDEPDTDELSAYGATSLVKDIYWNRYVRSLSGVPVIKAQMDKGIGDKIADKVVQATGAMDAYSLKDLRDWRIWGEGKDGRILIGADGKTFEFKNNTFSEIETIEPSRKSYQVDSMDLKPKDKKNLIGFMEKLKAELLKL